MSIGQKTETPKANTLVVPFPLHTTSLTEPNILALYQCCCCCCLILLQAPNSHWSVTKALSGALSTSRLLLRLKTHYFPPFVSSLFLRCLYFLLLFYSAFLCLTPLLPPLHNDLTTHTHIHHQANHHHIFYRLTLPNTVSHFLAPLISSAHPQYKQDTHHSSCFPFYSEFIAFFLSFSLSILYACFYLQFDKIFFHHLNLFSTTTTHSASLHSHLHTRLLTVVSLNGLMNHRRTELCSELSLSWDSARISSLPPNSSSSSFSFPGQVSKGSSSDLQALYGYLSYLLPEKLKYEIEEGRKGGEGDETVLNGKWFCSSGRKNNE